MVAIEERVHPTPFRTRKLSSPSPMILHNVMWESRPLPKIVRDPLAAHSARGSFFVPAPPGIFCLGDAWRFEERKACGEGNLFGKRFSLPAPLPSKNFCRWVCARMEEPVKKTGSSISEALYPGAWKSVPFEAESVGGKERKGIAGARQRLSRGSLANWCRLSAM